MKLFRLSVALQLLLVFVSGVVVGGLAYRLYERRIAPPSPIAGARRPDAPRQFRERFVEEMRSRLKLSEGQVQKLNQIMDATGHRFMELRKRSDAEMKALQDEQIAQIRAMLDSTQRSEYDKMLAERAQQMERMRKRAPDSRRPPDSGPPPGPGRFPDRERPPGPER